MFLEIVVLVLCVAVLILCYTNYISSTNVGIRVVKPRLDVDKYYNLIEKECEGVLPGSYFYLHIDENPRNDKSNYILLFDRCMEKGWKVELTRDRENGEYKLWVFILKSNDNIENIIDNISTIFHAITVTPDCNLKFLSPLSCDFDYGELKRRLKDEHKILVTYIKINDKYTHYRLARMK